MYELKNGIAFDNLNDYFIHAKTENAELYFAHFLSAYEKSLTKRAKAFLGQYSISTYFTDDLKQIFAAVAWNKLKDYDVGDPIPFLQKIKYDTIHAWHEFIRLSCGATAVQGEKIYTLIRRAAQIYYAETEKTAEERIADVRQQLKLVDDNKVYQLLQYAEQFRYAAHIMPDSNDEEERAEKDGLISESRISENSISAEDEYFAMRRREIISGVAETLKPNDIQIVALTTGVCPFCLGNIPHDERRTYEQLALLQGASGGDVIEKKRKRILKKFRDALEENI